MTCGDRARRRRRGWDSNPRNLSALQFSRLAQSTTLPPLRYWLPELPDFTSGNPVGGFYARIALNGKRSWRHLCNDSIFPIRSMMQRRSMSRSAPHARFPRQFASMARWHSHSPPRTPPGRSAVSKAALPRLPLCSTASRSAGRYRSLPGSVCTDDHQTKRPLRPPLTPPKNR